MKTTTIVEEPLSTLDQLRSEVVRLGDEVATAENKLAAANSRSSQLASEIESAEDALIHGRVTPAEFRALRDEQAAIGAEAAYFSGDIRMNRRLLEKARQALATEIDRSNREQRQRDRRHACEKIAPLVDAAAAAIAGILSVDGVSRELPSLDDSFQILAIPVLKVREALAGGDSALAVLIRDLKKAAPDLITSAMLAFLELRPPRGYQRPIEPPIDAQVANRELHKQIQAANSAFERTWRGETSNARSIPQVGSFR